MDIASVVQAITVLYDCSVSVIWFCEEQQTSPEFINKAERFLSDIVNDNSIVIDLEGGFAQGSDIVVFGLCNIVYQQVGKYSTFYSARWGNSDGIRTRRQFPVTAV